MKLVSQLVTGKRTINLVDFFKPKEGKPPIVLIYPADEVFDVITKDNPVVEIDDTFYQYDNQKRVDENGYFKTLKESFIDYRTPDGCLETCKRFAALAICLEKQKNVESGEILSTHGWNFIGSSGGFHSGYLAARLDNDYSPPIWVGTVDRQFPHSGINEGWGRFWSRTKVA